MSRDIRNLVEGIESALAHVDEASGMGGDIYNDRLTAASSDEETIALIQEHIDYLMEVDADRVTDDILSALEAGITHPAFNSNFDRIQGNARRDAVMDFKDRSFIDKFANAFGRFSDEIKYNSFPATVMGAGAWIATLPAALVTGGAGAVPMLMFSLISLGIGISFIPLGLATGAVANVLSGISDLNAKLRTSREEIRAALVDAVDQERQYVIADLRDAMEHPAEFREAAVKVMAEINGGISESFEQRIDELNTLPRDKEYIEPSMGDIDASGWVTYDYRSRDNDGEPMMVRVVFEVRNFDDWDRDVHTTMDIQLEGPRRSILGSLLNMGPRQHGVGAGLAPVDEVIRHVSNALYSFIKDHPHREIYGIPESERHEEFYKSMIPALRRMLKPMGKTIYWSPGLLTPAFVIEPAAEHKYPQPEEDKPSFWGRLRGR